MRFLSIPGFFINDNCSVWASLSLCLLLVFSKHSVAQSEGELERAWETDPRLNGSWVSSPPVRAIELNLADFDSDSVSIRFRAAQMAHELGMQNLGVVDLSKGPAALGSFGISAPSTSVQSGQSTSRPEVVDKLLAALEKGESNLRTRLMLIAAASAWSDESSAARLFSIAENDTDSRASIEGALIRLRSTLPLQRWRSLVTSSNENPSEVGRALDGIGACGQADDAALLRAYLLEGKGSAALQVSAARALGLCATSGQVDLAQQILNSENLNRFLLASLILVQHSDELTLPLLRKIVAEGGGEAKQIAFVRLSLSDRAGARELAPALLIDTDSGVRQTVISFLQSFDDRASFLLLARRLADPFPSIRQFVRKELLRRSSAPEFRPVVDKIISQAITAPQFEAIEQAIVLMVELSDTSRDEALLKLLDHPKPEVSIRAAWALRILATNPKTLSAMLDHAVAWADKVTSATTPAPRIETDEHRIVFLIEAFGIRKVQKAEPFLRRCVKKAPGLERLPLRNRLAGVWAIGMLYENRKDSDLRQTLEDRMNDMPPIDAEPPEIRYVCAIAIGKNGAKGADATLNKFLGTDGEALHEACTWAFQQVASKNP